MTTGTPWLANCQAASQPARPPPTIWTGCIGTVVVKNGVEVNGAGTHAGCHATALDPDTGTDAAGGCGGKRPRHRGDCRAICRVLVAGTDQRPGDHLSWFRLQVPDVDRVRRQGSRRTPQTHGKGWLARGRTGRNGQGGRVVR